MAKRVSVDVRQELVCAIGQRYRGSAREDKARILDEFVAVTGYHRKHAIRLLCSSPAVTRPKRAARLRLSARAVDEANG